jgi:cobalt-zinc-cadmium efflux system outer membrane protein
MKRGELMESKDKGQSLKRTWSKKMRKLLAIDAPSWRAFVCAVLVTIQAAQVAVRGQAQTIAADGHAVAISESQSPQGERSSLSKYVDTAGGMTADEAVAYALAHNGELLAARTELDAARARVQQAGLRANPRLDVNGSRQIDGKDNSVMVSAMLPLELGGRRSARIEVAERELELREQMVADRERTLAAEVRARFGNALAQVLKLGFTEELLTTSQRGYRLVVARVIEGSTAPLERNMVLVEVNRLRSVRESNESNVEVAMLELRNIIGMRPEEPLRLCGDFGGLIDALPPLAEATERALRERPDLRIARAGENLAAAQIQQARAAGKLDASLAAGYQRMNSSFPVRGINDVGQLKPVQDVFNFFTFGVSLDLPVRNKNQGSIAAAVAEAEAARQRREFAELTIRREVAAAYARYERTARAMEIFRVGVRDQASTNLTVVRQTYELGAKTLLDYIAEQRRFIELENQYIEAVRDTYLARVEIERATASTDLVKR